MRKIHKAAVAVAMSGAFIVGGGVAAHAATNSTTTPTTSTPSSGATGSTGSTGATAPATGSGSSVNCPNM